MTTLGLGCLLSLITMIVETLTLKHILGIHIAQSLSQLGILYIHLIEPRMVTQFHKFDGTKSSLTPIRKAFKDGTFIVAGG